MTHRPRKILHRLLPSWRHQSARPTFLTGNKRDFVLDDLDKLGKIQCQLLGTNRLGGETWWPPRWSPHSQNPVLGATVRTNVATLPLPLTRLFTPSVRSYWWESPTTLELG